MNTKAGITAVILAVLLGGVASLVPAENRATRKMPPANVVVSRVMPGTISPEKEFIGTIYYPEVSDVPAEVSGTVKSMAFEEGQRVEKGDVLVVLDSDLIKKNLQVRKAEYEQVLSDLERANKDLERLEHLHRKKIASGKDFDDQRFSVKSLEKKAVALKAVFEYLEIELQKTIIKAPFVGIIVKRHVSRGEWLSPGKTVATIARDDVMDVIVEVPERVAAYVKRGIEVQVTVAKTHEKGTVVAVIPRGDITTRTFPVKIRITHSDSLFEGMAASVRLPMGRKIDALMVPRDAALNRSAETVVTAVVDGKAMVVPVSVVGYQGMKIGIQSNRITSGMKVVVKGNERLRNGQPVNIIGEIE